MRIALLHHWLTGMRGGEKVLEAFCRLYPSADVYTLFYDPAKISDTIKSHRVIPSYLNGFGFLRKRYTNLFPILPFVTEQFDLTNYDLILSSDALCMKGVISGPDAVHISFCHTPPRYAWDMQFDYLRNSGMGLIKGLVARYFLHKLRNWDHAAADRVDYFIANSRYVARRIAKTYRRSAYVAHPPVELDKFSIGEPKEFYLSLGQLVPYKRIDILVDAFAEMPDKRLVVVGSGPMLQRLKQKASANVSFVGWASDAEIVKYYQTCRAFLFPGLEDYGIAPLEAQASGRPVIAFGKGGVLETVTGVGVEEASEFDGSKHAGLFFGDQTASAVVQAIEAFEKVVQPRVVPHCIRGGVERFSEQRFQETISSFVDTRMLEFRQSGPPVK